MSLKLFCVLAPVALGGFWVSGGLGSGGAWTRDVERTPAQVMAALGDLDVRTQPGSPGTDPAASGGVRPVFVTERGAGRISFVVMSGNRVATRMTATLEPIDGGAHTRVTATVERGDAPDEIVSPAFRSTGLTLGLFSSALEDELNELVSPPSKSRAECNELERNLLEANAPDAAGNPLRMIGTVHAVEAELRRQGCDTRSRGTEFQPVSNRMGAAPVAGAGGASFEPGRPMVDVGTGAGH